MPLPSSQARPRLQRGFGETKAQDTAAGLTLMFLASMPMIGNWFGTWADVAFGMLWILGLLFALLGGHGFMGLFMFGAPGKLAGWAALAVALFGAASCADRMRTEIELRRATRALLMGYAPELKKGCGAAAPHPDAKSVAAARRDKPATAAGALAATHAIEAGAQGPRVTIAVGADERLGTARTRIPPGTVLVYEAWCEGGEVQWRLVRMNQTPAASLPGTVRRYLPG